jgi:hypothetical protein
MTMPRSQLIRIAKRSVVWALGLSFVFVALVGFAHTKAGRPILAVLGTFGGKARVGGCPLGFDVAGTPEQKEAARAAFASTHRGAEAAVERPALGFVLDQTTREDVVAWGAAHGVTCAKPLSNVDLDCKNVPPDVLPAPFGSIGARDLWFTFGGKGALVSVVAIRRDRQAQAISTTYTAVTRAISEEAGQAAASQGDGSVAQLSSGLLQQASAEYKFRNYYAVARASNMGDGYVMTEEYRSLPN